MTTWCRVPREPTLAQLQAGYAVLAQLYPQPPFEAALGQLRVYEAMLQALPDPAVGVAEASATPVVLPRPPAQQSRFWWGVLTPCAAAFFVSIMNATPEAVVAHFSWPVYWAIYGFLVCLGGVVAAALYFGLLAETKLPKLPAGFIYKPLLPPGL